MKDRKIILTIYNNHSVNCGEPPTLDNAEVPRYLGYFQNEHGEQWLFTYNYETETGKVQGGDAEWGKVWNVVDGLAVGLILSESERMWLAACWEAATAFAGARQRGRQEGNQKPPQVTEALVSDKRSDGTQSDLQRLFHNVVYAETGSFSTIVDEDTWAQAVARIIAEEGAAPFLANVLSIILAALGSPCPPEIQSIDWVSQQEKEIERIGAKQWALQLGIGVHPLVLSTGDQPWPTWLRVGLTRCVGLSGVFCYFGPALYTRRKPTLFLKPTPKTRAFIEVELAIFGVGLIFVSRFKPGVE